MMKKIQPTDIDADIKYTCPYCDDEYWLTKQEASTVGFKIACYCDKVFEIEPITKIQFIFSKTYESAVRKILKHNGYSSNDINIMIEHAGSCNSKEELLRKAIAYSGESISTKTT